MNKMTLFMAGYEQRSLEEEVFPTENGTQMELILEIDNLLSDEEECPCEAEEKAVFNLAHETFKTFNRMLEEHTHNTNDTDTLNTILYFASQWKLRWNDFKEYMHRGTHVLIITRRHNYYIQALLTDYCNWYKRDVEMKEGK